MRLNHSLRRALRLLDRGDALAYDRLPAPIRDRLEDLGYVRPAADRWLLTKLGRESAGLSQLPSASVMVGESPIPDPLR